MSWSVAAAAQTIFALASAPGKAGIAVVRVSGAAAGSAIRAVCRCDLPPPRRARLDRFCHPVTQELLDHGLVLWFPGPGSFTGEDTAEFHIHGGQAILQGMIEALGALPGLRLAEPGEFTRRAFEHGKLDLTAVEGLADLVAAETAQQRRQALFQLEGQLGELYESWRRRLLQQLAYLEASIDFADEELPDDLSEQTKQVVEHLLPEVEEHLRRGHRAQRLRETIRIAILGAPNVGKSSLFNALVGQECAITSKLAGTTRDVIEAQLDIGGYPVTLADTAGLRSGQDQLEQEGIRRAQAWGQSADLRIVVFDASAVPKHHGESLDWLGRNAIAVVNKIDLPSAWPVDGDIQGNLAVKVSVRSGVGLAALRERLLDAITANFAPTGGICLTRERHHLAVTEVREYLQSALDEPFPELMAENLRQAAHSLGRITGRVEVEDLLEVIFRDFCVGK